MLFLDHNLYISSIDAYIDPKRPVDKAIITHAHADHAKPNHNNVLATEDTINIMKIRYGNECAKNFQILKYGERIYVDGIYITLYPAGHVLGSAQVLLEKKGYKVLVTGDFKTIPDATAQKFELIKTNTLITEATFGLPIFCHPDPSEEVKKIITSLKQNPEGNYLIGVYSLGKAQRVINMLRVLGYTKEIYIHGSIKKINQYYLNKKINLGLYTQVNKDNSKLLKGQIILAPPSAIKDVWSRKINNKVIGLASGWMAIKQRAKQKLIELPIILSDHADWNELTRTIKSTQAEKVLITHGQEDCLKYWCKKNNINADALDNKNKEL